MKAIPILLTAGERVVLTRMAEGKAATTREARRARIILECAKPEATNASIATLLNIERPIVQNWRKRFAVGRVDGLRDLPRSRSSLQTPQDVKDQVIALTLNTFPEEAQSWTLRLMGDRVGLSHTAIAKIWKEHGITRSSLPVKPAPASTNLASQKPKQGRRHFARALRAKVR